MYSDFDGSDLEMLKELKECLYLFGYDRALALDRFIEKYGKNIRNANNLILLSDIVYINATRSYIVACSTFRFYNVFLIYFLKRDDGKYEVLLCLYPFFSWNRKKTLVHNSIYSISKRLYAEFILASINPELTISGPNNLEYSVSGYKAKLAVDKGGIFVRKKDEIYVSNNTKVTVSIGKWKSEVNLKSKENDVCWCIKIFNKNRHKVSKKEKEKIIKEMKEEN